MAPISGFQVIECRTIDNTIIRGCFYAVTGPAPVIIMTPGFNCVKEMLLPDVAEIFQSSGFNAFIYDPRSIGDSDGSPRNQIDPLRQAEDLTDIITHISGLPSVDASQIILWGMSFGATVSACTAALDRRVKGLVMVCPILSFVKPEKRGKAFVQIIKDRQSQLRGNEAFTLPPFNARGENPIGMAGSGGPGGLESFQFMNASYFKLALFEPKSLLSMLDATPIMMIVPELDAMSPPEEQIEAFEKFQQPKRLYIAKGKGHLTVLSGDGSEKVSQAQIQFMEAVLHGGLTD
ncbi:hypothetical protein E0Z10_g5261 [Xylaria hypoxylon]|uniref:AB hydrolase-1 domain-containing protein n=1 Tax=Xylaria hypoxylon TaxID=37992 RepID=A0A4Z0YGQ2_9PEZI|nr:hypothetical protein E0Z10_g5261 [Xylaria hypoxylon]